MQFIYIYTCGERGRYVVHSRWDRRERGGNLHIHNYTHNYTRMYIETRFIHKANIHIAI